ncbi:MAG TPA: site-specific DNA-methyltransferase [Flavipsychrobacter sp.]|nr:site-specific DNA-methyltransferase [Flavipsychrobacter sp.]
MKLSNQEREDLIDRLQKGEAIPDDYKYKLFPVKQKEYELVYGGKMRREDILANEDGVFPVPLQVEKIYNGNREQWEDGWKNIIAFGDNLQFLKTIYENKDPLIKNKVKEKVKLIYIDPPFGTDSDFSNSNQTAYTDKAKGADFVEFLRRRLIVARELLSPDGSIMVHLDYRKGHYIKVLLDEVFGEANFRNEIIWQRTTNTGSSKALAKKFSADTDTIFYYAKSASDFTFNKLFRDYSAKYLKRFKYEDENGFYRWSALKTYSQKKYKELDEKGMIRNSGNSKYPEVKQYMDMSKGVPMNNLWNDINHVNPMAKENLNYPTQKPEELIERVIRATTNNGDIVMDFFGGSGTIAAVAEKLNRKWVTCDVGKLSFYTMQKRLLNIQTSKAPNKSNTLYEKPAKSFITLNTGHYDLKKVFDLQSQEYSNFVMNLFEVEPKKRTISGIQIDGEKKDGYNVIIWQYWKFKDSSVDEEYLHDLHSHIGAKAGKRVYIIAPASYVDFISDYYEIDKVRYYFLKVPYHIIRELHKVQFKKFRQPQSKSNVNDLEDAIGFHFMRQPEVKSELKDKNNEYHISLKKFVSDFSEEETERDMENFESLAMVLIDKDFDGETFDMDTYYFAEDLLPKKKKKKSEDADDESENIKEGLKHTNQIVLPPIPKNDCGKKLMIIYVDIYGNEFKEEFKLK